MSDTTSSTSANLDSATIWAAQIISDLAYGNPANPVSGQWAYDPTYANDLPELILAGWTAITPQDVGNLDHDPTTNYQGIAFYKVVNGQAEIIIANRGTCQPADLLQDAVIAIGQDPQSDQSALNYYNAVVGWASNNLGSLGASSFNVVETGHSLGGQEADFVMAAENSTTAAPETITFDAPGIGPEASASTNIPDALNLYNAGDLVHDAGGTYLGILINAMPSLSSSRSVVESAAAGAVLGGGFGAALGAIGSVLFNGFTTNHSLVAFGDYFKSHPVVGGVNLTKYAPNTFTQGIYDQMSSYGNGSFTSTYAQIFAVNSGSTSTGSTTTNNQTETFAAASSGNSATETGNLGDIITNTLSGDALTTTTNQGFTETQQISNTGALQSDTWSNAAGTNGTDTYNADGSSSGRITYANGSYAMYTDDGQGNISTDYYTAAGVETRATWVHADGTSGEVSMYGDGLTLTPGGGPYAVQISQYTVVQNPDGSYVTDAWDAQDSSIYTDYSGTGAVTSTSTGTGTGVNDLAVASSQDQFVEQSSYSVVVNGVSVLNYAGMQYTYNYNASDALVGDTWYSAIVGTVSTVANPNGAKIAWANNIMATSGTDTLNASGVLVRTATAVDGTIWQDSTMLTGDTVSHYTGSMSLLSDSWSDYNGGIGVPTLGPQEPVIGTAAVTGSDTFSGNSGSGSFTDTRDGTSGTVTLDGQGDISISNTNAVGTLTSMDSWNGSNGSYTIAMYNSAGVKLSSYDYLANGNVTVTDYAVDGSIADTQTEVAGLVVNPDGSDFSDIVNTDGSYTIYYQDAQGDVTAWQYNSSGNLTGSYHTSDYNYPHSDWSGVLNNGQAYQTAINPSTPTYTDSNGNTWTVYENSNGQATGKDYVNASNGTHGYLTFYNASGTDFYEEDYNADGSYDTIANDGQGNATEQWFDSGGNEYADAWTAANGSHGYDNYNADGSYLGMTYNTDGSTDETVGNADGSSSEIYKDSAGNTYQYNYDASGNETSSSWSLVNGSSGEEAAGNDTLFGGTGTGVVLQGGSGSNVFVAGSGNETLVGGSGSNTYQFNNGFGNIEVSDIQAGDILLFGTGISAADLTLSATIGSDGSAALLIQTDNGGSVVIDDGLNGAIAQFTFAGGATLTLDQLIVAANTVDTTVQT